jgi:hypothetical protein
VETLKGLETVAAWLAARDPGELAGDDLAVAVLAAERVLNAGYALSAAVLACFERDRRWAADGALSAAQWTAQRSGTSLAELHRRARQGEALQRLRALTALARNGRLSAGHLQTLCECAHHHPGLTADYETLLAEQAQTLDADSFRLAARRRLRHVADPAAVDPVDANRPIPDVTAHNAAAEPAGGSTMPNDSLAVRQGEGASRLYTSRTVEGCLRLDGWFAPHDADLLDAALGAGVDRQLRAAADGDPSVAGRPVAALRAGALVDLVAQSMRHHPSEQSAPDRYRVAVVVHPGDATIPPEAACDHAVAYRAVLDANRDVLDIGRQTARWPPAIRRAITLRDRGCIFPGCDRPPSWADIHHCTPYKNKGTTSFDNGALLCRRHHRFIHTHGWRVTIDGRKPVVRRPDGQPHVIQRWPPPAPHTDTSASISEDTTDAPPPVTHAVQRE